MSEIPPPQYVSYPRSSDLPYGSIERLKALGEGYFGLNNVFLINVVAAIAMRGILANTENLGVLLGGVLALGTAIAVLTYGPNKRIGVGKEWPTWGAPVASVLMGINSALCCGLLGYVVMQQIAAAEIRRYGIKYGMFGFTKKKFEEEVARLTEGQMAPPHIGV